MIRYNEWSADGYLRTGYRGEIMRMDRRVQKTRSAIMQAFERLLLKKSYDDITIQDIIDEANIGRSTFYAHFETKDSLLEAICSGLFDHIFSRNLNAEPGHDFSGSEEDVEAKLIHTLYHLQEDRKRLSRIFSCESAGLFWEYFQRRFSAFVQREIVPALTVDIEDVPRDYVVDFFCNAFIATVKWWFYRGLKATPEEVSGYFLKMTIR